MAGISTPPFRTTACTSFTEGRGAEQGRCIRWATTPAVLWAVRRNIRASVIWETRCTGPTFLGVNFFGIEADAPGGDQPPILCGRPEALASEHEPGRRILQ